VYSADILIGYEPGQLYIMLNNHIGDPQDALYVAVALIKPPGIIKSRRRLIFEVSRPHKSA
jgi:hypothetical protein